MASKKKATKGKNKSVKAAKKSQAAEDKAAKKVAPTGPQRRRSPEDAQPHDAMLDESSRRDIGGVIFVILAIVVLLLAVLPADALVSGFASQWIHLLLGIGCYILPVILLAIAAAFFWRFERRGEPGRIALGFGIMFVGLLALFALFAPISVLGEDDPSLLFSESALVGYGGYIGSAIAWAGLVLLGRIITAVILVGIIVIGGVVVGFSVSAAIERMRSSAARIGEMSSRMRHRNSELTGGFARVRRQDGMSFYDAYQGDAYAFLEAEAAREGFDPANTAVLGMPPTAVPYPQPAYDDAAAVSTESRHGRISRRLDVTQVSDEQALTRRLSPIDRSAHHEKEHLLAEEADLQNTSYVDDDDQCDSYDDDVFVVRSGISAGLVPIVHADLAPEDDVDRACVQTQTSNPRKKASKRSGVASVDRTGEQTSNEGSFCLPPFSLLNKSKRTGKRSQNDLSSTAEALQTVLSDFGIDAHVVDWVAGPTVTLFEVDLPAGVRVSRVTALNDDIALALASPGVRIFAPVPGTNYVGIEVPNAKRETVLLSDVLTDAPEGPLQIAIGKDVEGNSIVSDLARMPHLLIGGTTGSGKSVSINGMIMSMLMRATPDEVRFIMIDPKRVEFTPYNGIPHLYVPVVTEPAEAASALAWGVAEMERRLKVFSKLGARNIAQYNAKADEDRARRVAEQQAAKEEEDGAVSAEDNTVDDEPLERLPYIVIIIDELADLMMNIGKEVEISISRIAQIERAEGIHLIVATQRPSTNVVTCLIKANITNRIAFNVASGIDSRVILDAAGAESLIGLGDLLLSKPELAKPQRIQGCFVTEDEINKVVEFVKAQGEPEYHGEILSTNVVTLGASSPSGAGSAGDRDPLVWEAADMVVSSGIGSTSNIQRRLKVGYARAGRIMDQLEEIGVVGPANGSKPRDVLLDEMELESVKAFETSD